MTDQIAGGPHGRTVHWVAAVLIVVGFGTGAAALILSNIVAGVIGAVLLVTGAVMSIVTGLMQSVEEYPSGRSSGRDGG